MENWKTQPYKKVVKYIYIFIFFTIEIENNEAKTKNES
jgi:hypothetical protein